MIKSDFTRYIIQADGKIFDTKRHTYTKIFNSNKYLQCRLVDNKGKRHILGVHTAVAMAHCKDYFEGCVVHHKDNNTHNNQPTNLQCMPRSAHSRMHADRERLKSYVQEHGPVNKGKHMPDEFRERCRDSAYKRGFNGNQFVDKQGKPRI